MWDLVDRLSQVWMPFASLRSCIDVVSISWILRGTFEASRLKVSNQKSEEVGMPVDHHPLYLWELGHGAG